MPALRTTRPFSLLMLWTAACLLAGCGRMMSLKQELRDYDQNVRRVQVELEAPDCSDCTIVVVITGPDSEAISYRVFERGGSFDFMASRRATGLFAFLDRNANLGFDGDELSARHTWPADGDTSAPVRLSLAPGAPGAAVATAQHLFALRNHVVAGVPVQLAKQTHLGDTRFSAENAALGVWQPLTFMRRELAGIYFLEPYSPHKTPVLFVHGIFGNPRDFEPLIAGLDREKYQPWVLYYPSGLELQVLGAGALTMLNRLWAEYRFQDLHLVAHSMGGLVTRSMLKTCREAHGCGYVRSYTSISSPFGGMEAAHAGVAYAPVVVPVWRDLDPGSPFLAGLFAAPLPDGVPHHMVFGYLNTSTLSRESSDGTVPVASQLRPAAQAQASSVLGLDENHMSILAAPATRERLAQILAAADAKGAGR